MLVCVCSSINFVLRHVAGFPKCHVHYHDDGDNYLDDKIMVVVVMMVIC